jgi:AmpD protein
MHIDTSTGLIADVRQVSSPNVDARPVDMATELVVIHSISLPPGEFGGPWIEQLFCNQLPADVHPYFAEIHQLQVSAHVLIRRDGELVQFVPFNQRAWHAGQSNYCGRERCNDFSIGIELEGTDDAGFEAVQYQQLAALLLALEAAYPDISRERVVGHSAIAPGRKTDPGSGFEWDTLYALLEATELKQHSVGLLD